MRAATVGRRRGLALLLGGIALVLFPLSHPLDGGTGSPQWIFSHSLHFVGAAFVALGLSAIYERQAAQAGDLGRVAYVLAFLGTVMFAGIGMVSAYVIPSFPALRDPSPDFTPYVAMFAGTSLLMMVGYILFGIAIARAGAFPMWSAVVLALGAVLMDLPPFLVPFPVLIAGGVMFGATIAWLGYRLRSAEPAVMSPAAPV